MGDTHRLLERLLIKSKNLELVDQVGGAGAMKQGSWAGEGDMWENVRLHSADETLLTTSAHFIGIAHKITEHVTTKCGINLLFAVEAICYCVICYL